MERTRRLSKIIGVVLAVLTLIVVLLWMQGVLGGGKIKPGEVAREETVKRPLREETATRARVLSREEVVGTVTTRREVMVSPRIMGSILELTVKPGDTVEKGQTLVRIDDRDIRARLEQARSAVAEAESEYARAVADYDRFKRLRQQDAVPQQQFEKTEAAYRASSARLKGAREALKEAQINEGYTVIQSPVAGYVVEKDMEVGDMASPGRPILVLQEGGTLRLEAPVREGLAGRIELGETFPVKIDALDLETTGVVEEKVPAADPLSRSFLVKASLPQVPGLRSGMFGRLYVPSGSATPLTVPADAVRRVGQLEMVWVPAEGGVPARRYVRTGETYGDRIEILSGLDEGERVVILEE